MNRLFIGLTFASPQSALFEVVFMLICCAGCERDALL